MNPDGAIGALLSHLAKGPTQEEQVHTAYALRTIREGWTAQQRQGFVEWFDRARGFAGAASMEGYIENLWDSALEILPEAERQKAEAHKERILAERREEALALMAALEQDRPASSDLTQISFEELSEYLEYDPMAYIRPDLERGELVFQRSRCADCHVFGSIGRGGGPDLSTVTSRFRRRDILEAIMYPSRVISDQYTGVDVEMKDGELHTGMVVSETPFTLTLISSLGERMDLRKRKIRERYTSGASIMPEGLMETMSLGDLVALVQFLEAGSDL
jgi:putative heme-binding domain-containing protein